MYKPIDKITIRTKRSQKNTVKTIYFRAIDLRSTTLNFILKSSHGTLFAAKTKKHPLSLARRGNENFTTTMKILGNIIWWIFGGLEAAIGYFTGSLALACTIVGIPFALQTFKVGLLCLWPFGSEIKKKEDSIGCLSLILNIVWVIFGGLWACLTHILFGILLCITIVGIPFGKQHFKMAAISLTPFGREIIRK